MTTVSTKKNTKPKPPAPSTILTLTLNPDGTGTLVTKRGDLAYMNSFTYRDMKGLIVAIQQGAAQLVEIEKNPPPNQLFASPAPTSSQPAPQAESSNEAAEIIEVPDADEQLADAEPATSPVIPEGDDLPATANKPLVGVVPPDDTVQLSLL